MSIVLSATIDALAATITQQAYLKASNTGSGDRFGQPVAISGDTIVVGAGGEDSSASGVNGNSSDNSAPSSGAAYVFVRMGTNWIQQAYLKASNTDSNDVFGVSVAASADTIVVGAYRESSRATGINGDQTDNTTPNAGAAYVFVRNKTNWSQQAYLKASNTDSNDYFGISVAVSGDTIVVGAVGESSNARGVNGNQLDNSASVSGAAYVFVRTGTNWSQQAYLKASNTDANDQFGLTLAISGDTALIGAPEEGSNATGVNGNQNNNSLLYPGAAYVFVRSDTNWSQQAYLKASNTGAVDLFGDSVAISGDTAIIAAAFEDSSATGVNGIQNDESAQASGAAYIFVRAGTNWSQEAYLKSSNTGASDAFGYAVSISGETIAIGAYGEDSNATGVNGNQTDNSAAQSGAAYVFVRAGTNWSQQAYLKASNTEAGDFFADSIAVSGDTVVVGAYLEAGNATGANGDQSNNSTTDSGAAYVFTGLGLVRPLLSVVRSTQNIILAWPTNAADFRLQSTTNLTPPILWSDLTNTPSIIADRFTVTNASSVSAQFFRLIKP